MTRKDFCFVLFFWCGGGGGGINSKNTIQQPQCCMYGRARNSTALGMLYFRFLITDDKVFCYLLVHTANKLVNSMMKLQENVFLL